MKPFAKRYLIFRCAAACVILVVLLLLSQQPGLAQELPEKPVNATVEGSGNNASIYYRSFNDSGFSGIFKMNVSGTIYDSYCLDMYKGITDGNILGVNGPLSNDSANVNWSAVNYILYTYNYSNASDQDKEAAAIQAAIYYFTSELYPKFNTSWIPNETYPFYPKYQFMTDPTDGSNYDANSSTYGSGVRDRAFEIINDTLENGLDFHFPTRIELISSQLLVPPGQNATLTATVYDEDDNALEDITTKFGITAGNGTLEAYTGITDSSGQVVTNFTQGTENTTVVAWIEGNYGTLLFGNYIITEDYQNVTTVTTIPRSIEGLITLPIPELSTVALLCTGLLALIGYVRYRKKQING
jgi:hypothetical protein